MRIESCVRSFSSSLKGVTEIEKDNDLCYVKKLEATIEMTLDILLQVKSEIECMKKMQVQDRMLLENIEFLVKEIKIASK